MGQTVSSNNASGFRVVGLESKGPAENAGMEIFFDYIIQADHKEFESIEAFNEFLRRSEDRAIKFRVFSSKTNQLRNISVVAQRWSGKGLLGATFLHERIADCYDQGLQVLGVSKEFPADLASLKPRLDYLLGTNEHGIFSSPKDFARTISTTGCSYHVFNSDSRTTRVVFMTADELGRVGCDVATGALHALPLDRSSFDLVQAATENSDKAIRISKIFPGSPLAEAAETAGRLIEPFCDFVISVDRKRVSSTDKFSSLILKRQNMSVDLEIKNFRTSEVYTLPVTPRVWDGKGILGAAVQSATVPIDSVPCLRVLHVFEGGPASQLRSFTDYILAANEIPVEDLEQFGHIVHRAAADQESLLLTVFDAVRFYVKEVAVSPKSGWGGSGSLGCDLASGALHTIPNLKAGIFNTQNKIVAATPETTACTPIARTPGVCSPVVTDSATDS